MKFLLLIVLAVLIIGYLRSSRGPRSAAQQDARADARATQPMVACAWCALHVTRQEALPGRDGAVYCSAEHRRLAEAS